MGIDGTNHFIKFRVLSVILPPKIGFEFVGSKNTYIHPYTYINS